MAHNAFLACWVACAIAAWKLASRTLALKVGHRYPFLQAALLWSAGAYTVAFVLNISKLGWYLKAWPYREAIEGSLLILAAREIFNRLCEEIPKIGYFRRLLFNGAAGGAFIVAIASFAIVVKGDTARDMLALKIAAGSGLAIAVFIGVNLIFFRIFRQPHSLNLVLHARMLALYLFVKGLANLAIMFVWTSHVANTTSLGTYAVLFFVWSWILCSDGNTAPPRNGDPSEAIRLRNDIRELARETRSR